MWNIKLTKTNKRLCRELIHMGLEHECKEYVEDMQELVSKQIPSEELNAPYQEENGDSVEGPWHKRYIRIVKKAHTFQIYHIDNQGVGTPVSSVATAGR